MNHNLSFPVLTALTVAGGGPGGGRVGARSARLTGRRTGLRLLVVEGALRTLGARRAGSAARVAVVRPRRTFDARCLASLILQ